jgi:hypothetical protein
MNCSRSLAHRGSYRSIYQVLVSVITANFAVAQPGLAATHSDETPAAHAATVSLPLHFEQNKGQTDESVRFINRSSSATTFFRVQDLVMRLPVDGGAGSTVLKMRFDGASDEVALNGGDALASTSSYFRGNDSEQWVKGAQHFASLSYRELYDGIDLIFHGHEGELRYDFIVAPDGDPRQIRLSFDGADDIALAENGDLVLGVSGNPIIHRAPVVYQDVDGERVYVDASFRIDDQNSVLFALADYDRSRTLVIDPVISYSTFLGGTGGDSGRSVRVDPVDQTIIVTGSTESLDFPLAGAVQTTPGVIDPPGWAPNPNATDATFLWVKDFGRTDNYSAKITASTRSVVLSNPGWRTVNAIPINQSSTYTASVWVNSPDGGVGHIPAIQFFDANDNFLGTIGAIGPSGFPPQPPDTWIQRSFTFTPSAFPGLANATRVRVIVVQDIEDTTPNATTVFFDDVSLEDAQSPGFNLLGQISSFNISFNDVFVAKLTADGSALVFSTYLGGNGNEGPQNVELDSLGNIVVGGRTASTDFPTVNAVDATYAGPVEDAFLAKLTPDGSSLVFSTYIGGFDAFHPFEEIRGIVTDAANSIFVIGNTGAPDFVITDIISAPCVAAAQPSSADVFIQQYSPTGALLFSTCFGGSGRDAGRNLAFDSAGNVVATGWTQSSDFPTTPGVVQPTFIGDSSGLTLPTDGWVSKLDINTSPPTILASTYLGGDGPEFLEGLGIDGFDNVIVSGGTSATDYPTTPGAFQTVYGGDSGFPSGQGDAVITKLSSDLTAFGFSTFLGGSGDDFAWGLKMDIEDRPYVTGFTTSPDFPVADPLQGALSGPMDVIVTQLASDGSLLDFSTYLGGSGSENASNGITVLNPGNVFVTGGTSSADYPLLNPLQGGISGSSDAFITNISTPITVPATDCTTTEGGCNPTGGQEIVLPDGFIVPANATITQTAVPQVDPRVVNGRCDGVTPLSLFEGDLIIPGHLCGGADGFTVLVTETTNIDIRAGTVLSTGFPEVFSPAALDCERPIVTDRQLQDVMVWQTTDKGDLFEGRAIEVTHDCGSSRSRTRTLSFFVIGMFIDFGLGPNPLPDAETQAFVNLLLEKTDALIAGAEAAAAALKKGDANKLLVKARDIRSKLLVGDYLEALNKTNILLKFVDKAAFDTTLPFNHEGNLIMRAGNIKFILEVKVIPFTP